MEMFDAGQKKQYVKLTSIDRSLVVTLTQEE
jgi:hypothetical protein